jgi:hypothetical protein
MRKKFTNCMQVMACIFVNYCNNDGAFQRLGRDAQQIRVSVHGSRASGHVTSSGHVGLVCSHNSQTVTNTTATHHSELTTHSRPRFQSQRPRPPRGEVTRSRPLCQSGNPYTTLDVTLHEITYHLMLCIRAISRTYCTVPSRPRLSLMP